MKQQIYYINPVPKPRMTQRDAWKKRPVVVKYHTFCDEMRANRFTLPESGAHLTFVIPMPKSWSKKKRIEMNGKPHQQRPDVDNLIKAVMDAIFDEDCKVWNISASKLWGEQGKIGVTLPENTENHELITIR
ncbi:TPA: RusA family crossover junction endodeoxyribonuclease [Proteus mirabilis]|nr:RusA family crossover junction endodeoxyribonuclease [Proteus mirabilis]